MPVVDRAAALAEAGEAEAALPSSSGSSSRTTTTCTRHAELLRRLNRFDEAGAAYDRALELVHSDAERRFLEQRLAELQQQEF